MDESRQFKFGAHIDVASTSACMID